MDESIEIVEAPEGEIECDEKDLDFKDPDYIEQSEVPKMDDMKFAQLRKDGLKKLEEEQRELTTEELIEEAKKSLKSWGHTQEGKIKTIRGKLRELLAYYDRMCKLIDRKTEELTKIQNRIKQERKALKFKDYFTEKETLILVRRLKKEAKTDKKVAMFLAEQVFGKARGNIGLDGGEDGKPITTMAAVLDGLERKPINAIQVPVNKLIE